MGDRLLVVVLPVLALVTKMVTGLFKWLGKMLEELEGEEDEED